MPKVRSLGLKSLKSVWSSTWNRRSNSSSLEESWNPSANCAFRGSSRTASPLPSSPGRPRCEMRPPSSPASSAPSGSSEGPEPLPGRDPSGSASGPVSPTRRLSSVYRPSSSRYRRSDSSRSRSSRSSSSVFTASRRRSRSSTDDGDSAGRGAGGWARAVSPGPAQAARTARPRPEGPSDAPVADRFLHPTPSWKAGCATRPGCGSIRLALYRPARGRYLRGDTADGLHRRLVQAFPAGNTGGRATAPSGGRPAFERPFSVPSYLKSRPSPRSIPA